MRIKLTYEQWQALDYLRTSLQWGGVELEVKVDAAGRKHLHAHTAHRHYYITQKGRVRRYG